MMAKYRFEQIALNSKEKKKPTEEDRFTYIGLEHLDTGSLNVTRFGSDVAPIGEKLIMRKGDVLFGKRRAYQKKVAVAPFDGIFSAHGMVLRPKEDVVDKNFFPLFISSDYFLDAAIKISVGSLSPTINWCDLKDLEFEMPDLHTQKKLAEVLWAINNAIESYKKLISATDELVKSQFIEWFGGNQCTKRRLDTVAEITSGLTKNSRRSSLPTKLPYLRVANVQFNKLDLMDVQKIGVEEKEIEKALLKKGDLLIVEGNGSPDQIGRVSMWDGSISPILHQNHIIKARFNSGAVLPDFAMYYYMTDEGRQQILDSAATTSGLYTLSLSKISRFMLPVPSIDKQQQFVEFAHQSDKSKFAVLSCLKHRLPLRFQDLETIRYLIDPSGRREFSQQLSQENCNG